MFLACIYAAGLISSQLFKMPSLVGEIMCGIILGPSLLGFVPNPRAFVLLGEIGLILLVVEAGIDIDLTTLKQIGKRGVVIAIVGTVLPIAMALTISQALGYRGIAAVSASCAFAPTSLGIAMNTLRSSGIANTPIGQLIVAAAIIDDMIARKFFHRQTNNYRALTKTTPIDDVVIQSSFFRNYRRSLVALYRSSICQFRSSAPCRFSLLVVTLPYL